MSERIKKLEERVEKRKARIKKLNESLKDEKTKLSKDEKDLLHLRYNDVLKKMQETGVSPENALKAIDSEAEKNQSEEVPQREEGANNYENNH